MREVGGGIGMGNTCKPMAVSFQCMTKFTTKKKKIPVKDIQLCISEYKAKHTVSYTVTYSMPPFSLGTTSRV